MSIYLFYQFYLSKIFHDGIAKYLVLIADIVNICVHCFVYFKHMAGYTIYQHMLIAFQSESRMLKQRTKRSNVFACNVIVQI